MSTNDRFEPLPDAAYATCRECDFDAQTKESASEHMETTRKESPSRRSHSMLITNPTRPERIRSAIDRLVNAALTKAYDDIDEMIRRGDLTTEEATQALGLYPDFQEGWENWLEESDD